MRVNHPFVGPFNGSNCRLLCHMNGADAGIVFADDSRGGGHTFTRLGAAGPVTCQTVKKFGTAAACFSSANALQVMGGVSHWQFDNMPFSVDCWVNFSAIYGTMVVCGVCDNPRVQSSWRIYYQGGWSVGLWTDGTTDNIYPTGITTLANVWNHLCLRRLTVGGNIEFFVNGVRALNIAFGSLYASTWELLLGNQYKVYPAVNTYGTAGRIDEFRVCGRAFPPSNGFTLPNRES